MSIIYKEIGTAAIISLNRPKYLNTLTFEMVQEIDYHLKAISINKNIHLVIFKSEGDKAFCAGGDVKGFYEEKLGKEKKLRREFFYKEYKLNFYIKKYKKPIISFVNGICMGGGVGLAMHSKIPIVSEKTLFAMPETSIGLFPDVGSGKILSNIKNHIGIYLGLSGKRLGSGDLIELGLAKYCVNKNNFNILENLLIHCKNISSINKAIKQFSVKTSSGLFPSLNKKISKTFKYKELEEIFLKLNQDKSSWAKETLEVLKEKSPTSLKISLKQLQLASNKSLKEDLIMEYRLSQACMAGNDFYEGVRALLVDKDNKPKWNPNRIEDVSNELVMSHFKSLGKNDLKFK